MLSSIHKLVRFLEECCNGYFNLFLCKQKPLDLENKKQSFIGKILLGSKKHIVKLRKNQFNNQEEWGDGI